MPEAPHSRACGIRRHNHGPECHSNCPTCSGRERTWLPNLQAKKQHRAVYGWSSTGTGIVAACDKKGIFLTEGPTTDLPRCKTCATREAKG